jgi:hypothetical protein
LRGIWVISEEIRESLDFNAFYLFSEKEKNPRHETEVLSEKFKINEEVVKLLEVVGSLALRLCLSIIE